MIYLIAFLFVLAMVYLTKFRKVIFVAAGIAAAAVVIIAAMVEVHERQSDGVPPLPAGYTLDPQKRGDPWDMFPDANQSKPKNASLFDDLIPQNKATNALAAAIVAMILVNLAELNGGRLRMLLIKPQLISARFPMPN